MYEAGVKGVLIVIDGNDGSGKATQANLLAAALEAKDIPSLKIDFPRYHANLTGRLIGECLSGQHGDFVGMDPRIVSVLYAADRFESSHDIRQALAEGKVVVADRYASANQIHQGGKISDEEERKMFLLWLEQLEYEVFGIPRPDRIIYLKVPVETSLTLLTEKRVAKNGNLGDGERDQVESDRAHLEQSHDTAARLSEREPNWQVIDCVGDEGEMRTKESIHEEILASVLELLALPAPSE